MSAFSEQQKIIGKAPIRSFQYGFRKLCQSGAQSYNFSYSCYHGLSRQLSGRDLSPCNEVDITYTPCAFKRRQSMDAGKIKHSGSGSVCDKS